jgi:hypothetical protein
MIRPDKCNGSDDGDAGEDSSDESSSKIDPRRAVDLSGLHLEYRRCRQCQRNAEERKQTDERC